MKQLIVVSDMEGASGIFDGDIEQCRNGTDEWRDCGRQKMTSDVLAVCEAANEFGVDEILYYDMHYAGSPEFNVFLSQLPKNVKIFDIPERRFFWRRIRGQAKMNPYGIITVGQHSRFKEPDAYFPHTIQSPPIKSLWMNKLHIAELGGAVLNFQGTKYIANIGCAASEKEAKELSEKVHHITVKDKSIGWEPSHKETFSIIKNGVRKAMEDYENLEVPEIEGPYNFKMELCEGYVYDIPNSFPWKGEFEESVARWEAPSFEMGYELFHYVRSFVVEK